jgi:hypothetical protein
MLSLLANILIGLTIKKSLSY